MKKSNFLQRTISGLVYVAIILTAIFLNSIYATGIIFSLFSALAVFEFQSVVSINRDRIMLKTIHSLVSIFLFFVISTTALQPFDHLRNVVLALPYIAYIFFYLIAEIFRDRPNPVKEVSYALFSHFYCVLPLAVVLRLGTDTSLLLPPSVPSSMSLTFWFLPLFVFIWLNDTGAYLVGSMIGKHKLYERVSPKKTWEGLIGGIVLALIGSVAFNYIFPDILSLWHWIVFAFIVAFFANFGDLFESLLKRAYDVKDSGHLIPGHGGILDRIDSLLFAAIPAYLYVAFISFIS